MKWAFDHRGSAALTVLVIIVGISLGLFVHSLYHPAEAVIGGFGNVTTSANPHNFSATSSGVKAQSETQVCIFCHTPHTSITDTSLNLLNAPLWNHKLSSQSYTVKGVGSPYSNAPAGIVSNLLTTPPSLPDGSSKLCLSCHDGTVSVGYTNIGNITMVDDSCLDSQGQMTPQCISSSGGSSFVGTDLTKKHVVSIPMNQTLIDNSISLYCPPPGSATTELKFPWNSNALCGADCNQNDNVRLRPTKTQYGTTWGVRGGESGAPSFYSADYRYGVQCSSCHDPHLWASVPNNTYPNYMFLVDTFNRLCKACHVQCE